MKNKMLVSFSLLLLCKSFTLAAGGAHSKHKKFQECLLSFSIAAGHHDHFHRTFACPLIDVNAQEPTKAFTPLMVAVSTDTDFVPPLIERGACIHQTNKDGHTALDMLLDRDDQTWGKRMALRYLLKNNKCKHSIQKYDAETNPENILARLRTIESDAARAKAIFLAETIEALEDEKRRAVAANVLATYKTFPASVDDVIVSYVSDPEEPPYKPSEQDLYFQSDHTCVSTCWSRLRRK